IGLYHRARPRSVARQRLAHPLRFLLPEPGAALYVGKKEGGERAWIVHAEKQRAPESRYSTAPARWAPAQCYTRLCEIKPAREGGRLNVVIVGGGIGGFTLALCLHRAGIACRIYEAASEIRPFGVGVNILPHASRELALLGLESQLSRVAVLTREAVFFNRFGQLIYREPLGRSAGYEDPQYSVHRGDLQIVLLEAVRQRLGNDRVLAGWKCVGFEQDGQGAIALFRRTSTGTRR